MANNNPCFHCGDDCGKHPIMAAEKMFCCNGCKSVYEILENNNLDDYYSIDKNPGIKPVIFASTKYKFLENTEIADRLIDFKEGSSRRVRIFLPEIHCSSCIWLLENLKGINPGVISSEVNFLKKEATINFNIDKISFQELATLLDKIGYPPKFDSQNDSNNPKNSKSNLIKLGVTFFCFGNIMLFSAPEYLQIGAEFIAKYRILFTSLVFVFSLPLILYSAREYLVSAFKSIRAKSLNLDVPISIGIIALYGRSLYDMYAGHGPGYMDSFAGFLLFLLLGKWFQNKTYEAMSFERDYKSYFPMAVTKMLHGKETIIPLEKVETKDIILVRNEEIIPTDAVLMKGKCNIDYSFVTGESRLIPKEIGDEIFAGGKQIGNAIEIQVLKKVEQSYLTQLWNQDFNKSDTKVNKENSTSKMSKLSRIFIGIVLLVSLLSGIIWFFIDSSQVINIISAVLIVACPCALALSIPFTFGNAMRLSGKNKLFLKNTEAVEELGNITDIVFDKTGTITSTHESQVKFVGEHLTQENINYIYSTARNSSHPLSTQICSHLKDNSLAIELNNFKELPGLGISSIIDNNEIKIGSSVFLEKEGGNTNVTAVHISIANKYLGYFEFKHQYRKEFFEIIEPLRKQFNVHLLSGDNDSEKETLFPYFDHLHFNQKPIDKLNYIDNLQQSNLKVLMLGDGLNDAGALLQSNVGLVVSDDVYNFSPACDGIIRADKLKYLLVFTNLGKFSMKTLKRSYIFSLMYNLIGLSFAVLNLLTPLVAAILMPISSISVVLFTTFSIRYFGKKNF